MDWNSVINGTELNVTNQTTDNYVSYEVRPETYILPILFFIIFVVSDLLSKPRQLLSSEIIPLFFFFFFYRLYVLFR